MSDRERTFPIPAPRVRRPSESHQETIRIIQQITDERIEGRLPTMGTVTAASGLNVTVWIDGERAARRVPFRAKAGQEYAVGDRVNVQLTRSGEYLVSGSIGGATAVVGSSTVKSGAIRNTHIVGEVDTRITSAQNTATQGVTAASQAQSAASNAQSSANTANQGVSTLQGQVSTINSTLSGKADRSYVDSQISSVNSQLAGKAALNHSHNEYANQSDYQVTKQRARCIVQSCNCATGC